MCRAYCLQRSDIAGLLTHSARFRYYMSLYELSAICRQSWVYVLMCVFMSSYKHHISYVSRSKLYRRRVLLLYIIYGDSLAHRPNNVLMFFNTYSMVVYIWRRDLLKYELMRLFNGAAPCA